MSDAPKNDPKSQNPPAGIDLSNFVTRDDLSAFAETIVEKIKGPQPPAENDNSPAGLAERYLGLVKQEVSRELSEFRKSLASLNPGIKTEEPPKPPEDAIIPPEPTPSPTPERMSFWRKVLG